MVGTRSCNFGGINDVIKETSKKAVLSQIEQQDKFQEEEIVELALKDIGLI